MFEERHVRHHDHGYGHHRCRGGRMKAPFKLALFGLAAAGVFGATFVAGNAAEPVGLSNAEPVEHAGAMETSGGLPGLATTADGFTIVPAADVLAGGSGPYRFQVLDGGGGTVTAFDEEHTKRMHLIVVRRDFVGFVHDHPTMAGDGTWSTRLDLTEPGAYRVFADFVVDGDKHTLGTDLFVPGAFEPSPLPAPDSVADLGDGYQVELDGQIVAGEESELEFTIRRKGRVVTDIPDYLGAKGHLVALRDGDLAYLHVHADEDRLAFETAFPSPGRYRLFLQFDHGGEIRTAPFTIDAQEA
jgi:hypothetical protein